MSRKILLVSVILTVVSAVPTIPTNVKGIQIKNKGRERLWIEMTDEDSFSLPPGQMASVILNNTWSGKIFARSEECQFQKCNTPFTVAELSFSGKATEDRYRVSVINGYNKPIKIQPTGRNNFCKASSCSVNLKQECPDSHQLMDESNNIVACKPATEIFEKLCPHAVVSNENEMFSCKTSDSYFVSIG